MIAVLAEISLNLLMPRSCALGAVFAKRLHGGKFTSNHMHRIGIASVARCV